MGDLQSTRELLNRQLDGLLVAEPLEALGAIGAVQRDVATRQGAAVRIAVQRHTWSKIGNALGVSKQAAHQKFAREWAETLKNELKAEVKAFKDAMRAGDATAAGTAERRRDELIAELKGAGRTRK